MATQPEIKTRRGGPGQLVCTSTHCERRQECASPNDCTGWAKRRQTPCEHCDATDVQYRGGNATDGWVIQCDGCKIFVEVTFTLADEGSRP